MERVARHLLRTEAWAVELAPRAGRGLRLAALFVATPQAANLLADDEFRAPGRS